MPFYPGNSFSDGIWDVPFYPGNGFSDGIWDVLSYLAFCAELSETYRTLHRAGGLFVVLRFQILVLVCRNLGFIVHAKALLICVS